MKSLYRTPLYFVLLLSLGSLALAAAQNDVPGPTPTQAQAGGAAIIPTASGQIGVNPVSVLPDAEIFRGTASPDEADATKGAYFAVATNDAGDLDISIIDPELRDFLSQAAEEAPICGVAKRRALARELVRRRQQLCGPRYVMDEFEREFRGSKDVIENLAEEIRDTAPEHPVVQEVERLLEEAEAAGGEAEAIPEVAISLMSEGEVVAAQGGVTSGLGVLGVGLVTYVYHVFQADQVAAEAGGPKPSVEGIHIPSNSIQTAAEAKATESASETTTDSCPGAKETELVCGDGDCGEVEEPDKDDGKVFCKGKYKGCECAEEDEYYVNAFAPQEEAAIQLIIDGFDKDSVSSPPGLPGSGQCEDNRENLNRKDWINLAETLCAEHYDLSESFKQTYRSNDIFSTAYDHFSFDFEWKAGDADCENSCAQIFREGFSSTPCSYDSHTFASSGSYQLPCGEAKFEIRNPNSGRTGPTCGDNDYSGIPSNVWDGKAGKVYGDFCSAVKGGEDLRVKVDAMGHEIGSRKRSPPPQPSRYNDYQIELIWEAGKGAAAEKKCEKSCEEAMHEFASSPCGHKGGQTMYMSKSATYDVECGTYSYQIHNERPLALQKRQCFTRNEFGYHGDVHEYDVKQQASITCAGSSLEQSNIRRGEEDTFRGRHGPSGGLRYQTSVTWDRECELEGGVEEVSLGMPLGGDEDICVSLLVDNFFKCNNGGIGGHIQAGCVVYQFKAIEG